MPSSERDNPSLCSRDRIAVSDGSLIIMGNERTRLDSIETKFLTRELIRVLDDRFFQYSQPDKIEEIRPVITEQIYYIVENLKTEKISSFELAFEQYPYKKLQEICPTLNSISLSTVKELIGPLYGR